MSPIRAPRPLLLACTTLAALGLAGASAHAQGMMGRDLMHQGAKPMYKAPNRQPAEEAPPPALPGAQPSAPIAPRETAPSAMDPNTALFDAINRDDIVAARDAINRGADLHATNVLGLTPLDASVDLGRKDITFLLLSLRGADSGGAPPPAATASLPASQARPAPVERLATRHAPRHRTTEAAPVREAAPRTPKLFAGNGGTPIPQAGFLGFDTGGSR